MARSFGVVCAVVMLACAGCKGPAAPAAETPVQPAVTQAPATPLDEKKEELGGTTWQPQWDGLVEQTLPADLLSAQVAPAVRMYCPQYAQETDAQKREFWAYTFQAIAAAEAGLNPTSDAHHLQAAVNTTDSVTHLPSRQEGLMQLKYEDGQRYGCDFDWQKDRALPAKDPGRSILQPENNLRCGVKIIENQIVTQHKPLVSRTSYWSTLQPGTGAYRVFAKQMGNVPAECGARGSGRR